MILRTLNDEIEVRYGIWANATCCSNRDRVANHHTRMHTPLTVKGAEGLKPPMLSQALKLMSMLPVDCSWLNDAAETPDTRVTDVAGSDQRLCGFCWRRSNSTSEPRKQGA